MFVQLLSSLLKFLRKHYQLTLCTYPKIQYSEKLTPSDFRNQQACSVDFPKFLIFFDGYVGLPQGSLEPKNRRPKPHWSGAGAVSIFGPIFTYIN